MIGTRLYRFSDSAEFLRDVGLITQEELRRLEAFDKLRNKLVHRLVIHAYQPRTRNTVTQKEVDSGFIDGRKLNELLRAKTSGSGMQAIFKAGRQFANK